MLQLPQNLFVYTVEGLLIDFSNFVECVRTNANYVGTEDQYLNKFATNASVIIIEDGDENKKKYISHIDAMTSLANAWKSFYKELPFIPLNSEMADLSDLIHDKATTLKLKTPFHKTKDKWAYEDFGIKRKTEMIQLQKQMIEMTESSVGSLTYKLSENPNARNAKEIIVQIAKYKNEIIKWKNDIAELVQK